MFVTGKIEVFQDPDSCQSDDDAVPQEMTVEIDDAGGGPFLRLHTGKKGWSINDISDLKPFLEPIMKMANTLAGVKDGPENKEDA